MARHTVMLSDAQPSSIRERLRQGKRKANVKLFKLCATSPSPSQSTSAQTRPASRCRDRSPATRPPSITPSPASQAPASTTMVSDSRKNSEQLATGTNEVRAWYEKQWKAGYDLALKILSDASEGVINGGLVAGDRSLHRLAGRV